MSFKLVYLLSILSFIILFLLVLTSPKQSIYDESIFIENLKLLERVGLNEFFLLRLKDQSPGPLFQFIHYSFLPLTTYSMIGLRVVNYFLMSLTIFFTYLTLQPKKNSIIVACMYLSWPMTWVVSGMALTEIPSMLFTAIFIYILQLVLFSKSKSQISKHSLIVLAGLSLSLAIVGRSPFLMVVFACPILLFITKKQTLIILLIIVACIFPIYMFTIWNGLVPPSVQQIQKGMNVMYMFMAFGYMAIITFIIAYKWYDMPKYNYIIVFILTVVFIIINLKFHFLSFEPLKSVSDKIIPYSLLNSYKYIAPGVIVGISILYITSCVFQLIKNRKNVFFLFTLIAGLLIIATTLKSSAQFSSRYVVQAAPFFMIAYFDYIEINGKTFILQLVGVLLGIFSLLSYYQYL